MAMSARSYLSIGDVLTLLRQEFPDVTISKIRFLESQGLVNPERTPSGYRKFYEHDVERLRWVLRQQREHFLPLKVIKDRLGDESVDAAAPVDPPDTGPAVAERVLVGQRATAGRATVGAPEHGAPAVADDGTTLPGIEPTPRHETFSERATAASTRMHASSTGAGAAATSAPGPTHEAAVDRSSLSGTDAPVRGRAAGKRERSGAATRVTAGSDNGSLSHETADAPEAMAAAGAVGGAAAGDVAASVGDAGGAGRAAASAAATPDVPSASGSSVSPAPSTRSTRSGPAPGGAPGGGGSGPADLSGASLSQGELAASSGLDVAAIIELQEFGLLRATMIAGIECFDEESLVVATAAARLAQFGVEPRHLRLYKNAADREAGFVEQLVVPLVRQRNPDARARAVETAEEVTRLGQQLRSSLLRSALQDLLNG
jgi:DNA-binding transcriptional MerR regulator